MSRTRAAALVWAGVATAATILLPVGPGSAATLAGGPVVVRGTDFPVGTGLAHVGCESPFGAGTGPATPYVAQGPADAPLGQRSLGFDLAGGDAAGPVAYTGSLAAEGTASLAVHADQGTTGVAWVGYRDPADPEGVVWFGRAALSVPAGGWSTVDTRGLPLTWASYDVATGERLVEGPSATLEGMVAERGDAAGLVAITLGCDGAAFSVDALRAGGTTYDLEGLSTRLTMGGAPSLVAGQSTRINGALEVYGGGPVPHATAILERRVGDGAWETVRVVDAADGLTAVVEPPTTTSYRWRFADRPLAEGSTSAVLVVDVARSVTARVDDETVAGRVTPGHAGLDVSLVRAGSGEVVARGTTGAEGAYSFATADLSGGRYVVAVAPADGNLRGESTPVQVDGPAAVENPAATAAPMPDSKPDPQTDPTPDPTSGPRPTREAEPTQPPGEKPVAPAPTPAAPETTGPGEQVDPESSEPTSSPEPVETPAAETTSADHS